jgi:hypothetical protein
MNIAFLINLAAALGLLLLSGCSALDRYERAAASVKFSPRLPLNQDIPPAYRGYTK